MAKRVGVLDHHQLICGTPPRYVKKTVAQLLVRRLLAEQITHNLIRMLINHQNSIPAAKFSIQTPILPKSYQHHLEPKIIQLTLDNSEYMRYLNL